MCTGPILDCADKAGKAGKQCNDITSQYLVVSFRIGTHNDEEKRKDLMTDGLSLSSDDSRPFLRWTGYRYGALMDMCSPRNCRFLSNQLTHTKNRERKQEDVGHQRTPTDSAQCKRTATFFLVWSTGGLTGHPGDGFEYGFE